VYVVGRVKALLLVAGFAVVLALIVLLAFHRRTDPASVVAPAAAALPPDPAPSPELVRSEESARAAVERAAAQIVLAGVVLDFAPGSADKGTPAPNVAIRGREGWMGEGAELPAVQTGADGRFRVEIADPGRRPLHFLLLTDGSASLRPAASNRDLQPGQSQDLEIVLERYPKGDLAGVTVDPRDRPVPSVHVTAHFGQVAREAESDPEGRFRFPDAEAGEPFEFLEARRDGYMLLRSKRPVRMPQGGWEPMRVVLAPTARLVVRVVDERGEGLADHAVDPAVSPWESAGSHRLEFDSRSQVTGTTGPDGRIAFDPVWAEQRLAIEIRPPEGRGAAVASAYGRERDGTLLPEEAADGRPIVLRAGEERELTAKLAPRLRIAGVVVDEAGRPAAQKFVGLQGNRELPDAARLDLSARSDGEGRFAFEIPQTRAGGLVRVRASDQETFGFRRRGTKVASRTLDLAREPTTDLVLVLAPGLRIAGHVLAPDGSGVGGQVIAYSTRETAEVDPWGTGSMTSKDGAFALEALEPGAYDLWARPSAQYGEVRLNGVEAGREDVEIRVPSLRAAHVTIDVRVRGGEADKLYVLSARTWTRTGEPEGGAELPAEAAYGEPGAWPRSVVGMLYGAGGFSDERGVCTYSITPVKALPVELDLDEGLYWLGVKGADRLGRELFPTGTGCLHVGPGPHRLVFELAPSVPVEGRFLGENVVDLAVGVARRGKLLDLDPGHGDLRPFRLVGADGGFRFAAVPVGENEIWFGSPADLGAGRAPHRKPLRLDAQVAPFLEIDAGR
jgi:hypothetical protein